MTILAWALLAIVWFFLLCPVILARPNMKYWKAVVFGLVVHIIIAVCNIVAFLIAWQLVEVSGP